MFGQFLYYIVALLLFTLQQPGREASFPPLPTLFAAAAIFLLFTLACRRSLRSLASERLWETVDPAYLSLRYHRLQNRLSIVALGALAFYVYALNVKFYLQAIPGFAQSYTLSGVTGLALFLLHSAAIWYYSHPVHKRIYHSEITLSAFMRGRFAFSSAILVPWLLISLISDLLELLNPPAFFKTDAGELIFPGTVVVLFVLFGPPLVVRLWGCQSLPATPLRMRLEEFIGENRFRIGDFKLWPLFGGEMLTAAVVGILPRWRYILITKGLLAVLDPEEIKAVVAHEMGHVRRHHLLLYLCFFMGYSLLAYSLNDVILLLLLKQPTILHWALDRDTAHLTLFSLTYSAPILIMLIVYFRYIFGFFMRNSERQADLYAMQQVGHPYTLISSLQKIAHYSGQTQDLPSWHHFSIRQRIDFLAESYRNPELVRRHHRKLYISAVLFFAVLGCLHLASADLKRSQFLRHWSGELHALEVVRQGLDREPGNPEYYAAYGGLLTEMGRYKDAETALLTAAALAPENPRIMNNLAWFYATSPAPFSKPKEALRLALLAAALTPDPEVLDTLAESYYVNGKPRDALKSIELALSMEPKNREYYLKQKEKFETAVKNEKTD